MIGTCWSPWDTEIRQKAIYREYTRSLREDNWDLLEFEW